MGKRVTRGLEIRQNMFRKFIWKMMSVGVIKQYNEDHFLEYGYVGFLQHVIKEDALKRLLKGKFI